MSSDAPVLEAFDKEALVNRNPHRDFEAVEAARPPYNPTDSWIPSRSPNPKWQPGDGAMTDDWKKHETISIDPHDPSRLSVHNYKLMISTTVPRPIALVSTVSADGKSTNLAPFSYFQNVCADPPLYCLSFVGVGEPIDTLRNILDTGELCISLISDWFIEAANYTSTNAPPGTSEWALSGLHASPSKIVKPTYVAESAFSIECKLVSKQEITSPSTGNRSAMLVIVEAVQWHVRKDIINEEQSIVDLKAFRPVWRAGGITYGTAFQGFELPRPEAFRIAREKEEVKKLVAPKVEGQ